MQRKIWKIVIPVIVTLVAAASLWFASPQTIRALDITFPSLPSSGTLGQAFQFTVQVSVQDEEFLPIQSADLTINSVSSGTVVTCSGLPLTNKTVSYPNSNGQVQITASTAAFSYGYGYRTGKGYWQPGGGDVHFGYGYGYGGPTQSITYSVIWYPAASLPAGSYYVRLLVHGDGSRTFSSTSGHFTLYALTIPGGGPTPTPGVTDISLYTDSNGVFNVPATASSGDGAVQISFLSGDQATDKNGQGLKSITISEMSDPPEPPSNTRIIGLAYEFLPDGARFIPPVTLTFTYDPSSLPDGVAETSLTIATWDSESGQWTELKGEVDTVNHTITVQIDGFSVYAVIAHTRPASFTISGLTISPSPAKTGQAVTISARVTNNGNIAGSYTVTLKVDGQKEAEKQVTLQGATSTTVSLSTVQDKAGSFNINVNGLTGTLIVEAEPVPQAEFNFSQLNISPAEVDAGETVTINVVVANIGDLKGTDQVDLLVDGSKVSSQEVTLDAGQSDKLSFEITPSVVGKHTIQIGQLNGTFTVKETPTAPARKINWLLIGVVIGGVLIIALAVWLFVRRR